jgi:adenylate cyclase
VRVERTLAFLDLCGFTAFTEAEGDTAVVAVLSRLRSILRAVTEQRGVRITKWLGDGAMLSGLDPLAVVGCADEVRQDMATSSPLALRGGIVRGPVIMFEGDDYIGGVVNDAARLCRAAAPNQLLAAADVLRDGRSREPYLFAVRERVLHETAHPMRVIEVPTGFSRNATPRRTHAGGAA